MSSLCPSTWTTTVELRNSPPRTATACAALRLTLARPLPLSRSSLSGRSSVRQTQRRTLDAHQLHHAVDHRHKRLHLRHIAHLLQTRFSSVGGTLSQLVLGRLRNLEPKPPVPRYEWERPGVLIHLDVKTLSRFRKLGHRITGDLQTGCT
jgi:hypothetical protein